ncbi:MAG: HEAT repeat domain-containing protein [Candidatus Omnitrophota bacterium]
MDEKLSKEKTGLYGRLINSLNAALTNSTLYPPEHSTFKGAVKLFKDVLDMWLTGEEKIDLGITPDAILLNGIFVKVTGDFYAKVAGYMHKRGIIAVSFARGISVEELSEFFGFIKNDPKVISSKGGIAKNIGSVAHMTIKEIDYSSLLTSARASSAMDEKAIWQSLSGIGKDLKTGLLPESKAEFINSFLKDPKGAASVLNKIYRAALTRLDDKATAEEIKDIFSGMSRYFEKHPGAPAKAANKELSDIILNLDPALVASLFKGDPSKDDPTALSNTLFKGFSDDMVADFIASLMQSGDNINENMVKVFNKLVSGTGRSDSIASMVTDKLFEKKLFGENELSGLQVSVKELFETHPDNEFISRIYNLAVGNLIDRDDGGAGPSGRYSVLVGEYKEFLKEENLRREKVRLLLNILWLESDPVKFKKMCGILADSFKEIPGPAYVGVMKEMLELFTEKLSPSQTGNEAIGASVKEMLSRIKGLVRADKIISFIPAADHRTLDDIAYILIKAGERPVEALLDSFTAAQDQSGLEKMGYILSKMGGNTAEEIVLRIEKAPPGTPINILNEFCRILRGLDKDRFSAVAKKLITHADARMRLLALEEFCPESAEERKGALELFEKERHPYIKKKVLEALVKTGDGGVIKKLFDILDRGFFKNVLLQDLITLCGDFKVQESLPYLGRILSRRPFFNRRKVNTMRAEAVISLGRIGRAEALEYVKRAANDPNESVRSMCRLVLESDSTVKGKAA